MTLWTIKWNSEGGVRLWLVLSVGTCAPGSPLKPCSPGKPLRPWGTQQVVQYGHTLFTQYTSRMDTGGHKKIVCIVILMPMMNDKSIWHRQSVLLTLAQGITSGCIACVLSYFCAGRWMQLWPNWVWLNSFLNKSNFTQSRPQIPPVNSIKSAKVK